MSHGDSADALIKQLELQSHPEGGWYRETYRGSENAAGRAQATAILFLLKADERSHWHRVDADEMWIWQAGDPLELAIANRSESQPDTLCLGPNVAKGEHLQGLVPAHAWQAARPVGKAHRSAGYTLVSCMVVPGFEFEGFELAPVDWEPGTGEPTW